MPLTANSTVFVLEIYPLASWFLTVVGVCILYLWPCCLVVPWYGSCPLVSCCSVPSVPSVLSFEWYYPTLTASVEDVPFWKFMNLSPSHHLQCWAAAPRTVTWCWQRPRGSSRRPATPRITPIRRPVNGPCRPPPASSSSSPSLTLTWRRRRAASTTGLWWTRETQMLSSAARRPTGWR